MEQVVFGIALIAGIVVFLLSVASDINKVIDEKRKEGMKDEDDE